MTITRITYQRNSETEENNYQHVISHLLEWNLFSSVEQQSGLSNTSKQVVLVCVEVKSKACALSLEVWLRLKVIPPLQIEPHLLFQYLHQGLGRLTSCWL